MNSLLYSRKGQSLTKTGILITLLMFYAVLFVLIGLSYSNTNIVQNQQISGYSVLGSSAFGFFGKIFSGVSVLPWWVNSIIFTPLIIGIVWIIVSSLPSFNGGA
jgi:hypothetical protein